MIRTFAMFLLVLALAFPVFSQETKVTWSDLQKNIDSWIDGPVSLLATPQEKDIFKKLKSPEEKMQFIKIFWQRRDPILRTTENEFKNEFYERVDYADKNFGETGSSGWQSSRGQVYVMFGAPSRVDTQSIPDSSRPALLWVYDKKPTKDMNPNEALLFVYHDFKYVLAPPDAQPGDHVGAQQQAMDASFRYQSIPTLIQRGFADVRSSDIIDDRKNYDSLLFSVKSSEKFQIASIPFDARINDKLNTEVAIKKEEAPVYDNGESMFAEVYFKQELKQGDRTVSSNEYTASFNWSYKEYSDLQNIVVPLKPLEAAAGQYQLTVTVQDRISMVSESKTIPVTY